MAAVAFDTYKMIKRLRDAGFTDAQAEAVSGAVQEGSTVDLSTLATKTDLEAVRHRLEMKISETKSEIAETRAELKADNLRLETKIEAAKADTLKWMFGAMVAQTALIVGLLKLIH